jgi:hypothetical protein
MPANRTITTEAGRPQVVAVPYGENVHIREDGDTIGIAVPTKGGWIAWREGTNFGTFPTLAECGLAMQKAEEAELAARREAFQ